MTCVNVTKYVHKYDEERDVTIIKMNKKKETSDLK